MRYGRTSVINFVSQLAMSFAGFLATIVLTNTLGRDQYGTYVVVISVLAWMSVAGDLGLSAAVKKRVSEAAEGNYIVAGAISQVALFVLVAAGLLVVQPYLNSYMGIDATLVVILFLAMRLAERFVETILDAQHLVHISSLLTPVEYVARSSVQIGLVFSGFGIVGAFTGYAVGGIVATAVGLYFVSAKLALPSRDDFERLRSYAQFSWLASIKGRAFLSMDTLVLALFVSNGLIAVYEVSWNLASLFAIFGTSIRRTLFPEVSKLSSEKGIGGEVTGLLRVGLAYSGLFLIPGLVGGVAVGDVILQIYGEGFDTGYYILIVLTFSQLLYAYQGQFLNTLDAVDRPELTFRINAVFVGTNLALNLLLTWQFGWYGAAAATTTSAAVSLAMGYRYASGVMDVVIPFGEVGKQWAAAGIMAAVVFGLREAVGDSLPLVLGFVAIGGTVYLGAYLAFSTEFRTTVRENLPFAVPGL